MKLAAVSFALLSLIAVASADSLRSQIDTMDREIGRAMVKKDLARMASIMRKGVTSDFKYVELGQARTTPMSFDEMLKTMNQGISMMSLTVAEAHLLTLKQKGSTAWSTTRHTMVGSMIGPDKKKHVMSFVGRSEDTYVKRGGHWKMSQMKFKNESMKMDGKPMDPSKMMDAH